MFSIMAYVQIYEKNDVNVIKDKIEIRSYLTLYIWKVDHVLSIFLEELVDDKKQQFVRVSLYPLASLSIPDQCLIINLTGAFCFLSTEWVMQHIHKHSQGMLAEMRKKNVAVHCWTLHSQRIIWSSTINGNIHFFHWSYRVLCSATMSLIQPFPSLLVGRESGKLKGSGSARWCG